MRGDFHDAVDKPASPAVARSLGRVARRTALCPHGAGDAGRRAGAVCPRAWRVIDELDRLDGPALAPPGRGAGGANARLLGCGPARVWLLGAARQWRLLDQLARDPGHPPA